MNLNQNAPKDRLNDDDLFQNGLPVKLPFRVSEHRRGWYIWWTLWMFDSCILPIILFYAVYVGSHTSHYVAFAIITSLWGWSSYTKWTNRLWRLTRKDPQYRPLGATSRWWWDLSMYTSSGAIGLVALELVIATSFDNPPVRLLAMPGPSILYVIALYMLLQNTLHVTGMRARVALSSTLIGMEIRPPMFTIMEDVFAADVKLGRPAREAMVKLFDGSLQFRKTLVMLSWVWSVICLVVAIVLSVVVRRTSKEVGFGIAWAVSFPTILIMSCATAYWIERADTHGRFVVTGGYRMDLCENASDRPAV